MGAGRGRARRLQSLYLKVPGISRPQAVSYHGEIAARPAKVRKVLTRIDEIHGWFPLPFDLTDKKHGPELRLGEVLHTRGKLAGKTIESSLELLESTPDHVRVQLSGPVVFCVDVRLKPQDKSCVVDAEISCSGQGVSGHVLAAAANTILANGGLSHSVKHIRERAER